MSAARKAARELLAHGWQPIPVPRGVKKPVLEGWQNLRLTQKDIDGVIGIDDNVGLLTGELSGNLIDVDLDCEEAVRLADELLPATPMRSGRSARPRSHLWYHATGSIPATRVYKDVDADRSTLVEFRANGRQTLVPPSIHPENDVYQWDGPLEPADIDGNELSQAVARLASAALLVRRWPRQRGSRHDIANALAGVLIRGGWPEDEVESFVVVVARTAGDEESRSRGAAVRATARRIARDGPATGIPALIKLIGRESVERCVDWLGLGTLSAFTASTAYRDLPVKAWPEPLEQAALHGLAGEIVGLISPHTEADDAAILVQFLVAAGNCIGRGPHFRVESDEHHTNLFAAIVGATSKGRKGTSWGRVKQLFRPFEPEWVKTRIVNGLSSGEGLIYNVRDPITGLNHVRVKGRVVETEEIVTDPGVADKRLLVVEAELASTLRVIAREGNTLSPTVRSAWETGRLQTLVKNNPAVATDAHISIIGHISKDEIVRELDRTEVANGFANRFLWVAARRSKLLPDGGTLDDTDLFFIADRLNAAIASARGDKRLERDKGAREVWHDVYPVLSEGKPGLFGAVISRAEAQATRLSVLYTLLDQSPVIQRKHMEAALAVWRYVEASAQYIFGDSLGDPVADTILRALKDTPTGLTRNEIREMFGRNRSSEQISRALRSLQEGRLAHFSMEPTDGRPAERWMAGYPYAVDAVNAISDGIANPYRANGVNGVTEPPASDEPPADDVVEL